jgi:hypothetical protein
LVHNLQFDATAGVERDNHHCGTVNHEIQGNLTISMGVEAMSKHISQSVSRMAAAAYTIAAGFVMSWPLVAVAELIRLSN